MGLLAGFKGGFFPWQGWGGDCRGEHCRWEGGTGDKRDLAGVQGPLRGGKDSTYWLVMEAWVAGWGKLVVQTV